MGGFDKAFKLIGGNHGYAFTPAAAYYDDFPVLGNFITQPGKICPGVCINYPLPTSLPLLLAFLQLPGFPDKLPAE